MREKEKTCVCSSKLQFRPRSRFTLYHELFCRVYAVNTLFLIGWENWNQTSCQQDVKMSWRGRQLKRPRIRAGGFYFSRGFAREFRGPRLRRSCARLDKTAMLRRLQQSRGQCTELLLLVQQNQLAAPNNFITSFAWVSEWRPRE